MGKKSEELYMGKISLEPIRATSGTSWMSGLRSASWSDLQEVSLLTTGQSLTQLGTHAVSAAAGAATYAAGGGLPAAAGVAAAAEILARTPAVIKAAETAWPHAKSLASNLVTPVGVTAYLVGEEFFPGYGGAALLAANAARYLPGVGKFAGKGEWRGGSSAIFAASAIDLAGISQVVCYRVGLAAGVLGQIPSLRRGGFDFIASWIAARVSSSYIDERAAAAVGLAAGFLSAHPAVQEEVSQVEKATVRAVSYTSERVSNLAANGMEKVEKVISPNLEAGLSSALTTGSIALIAGVSGRAVIDLMLGVGMAAAIPLVRRKAGQAAALSLKTADRAFDAAGKVLDQGINKVAESVSSCMKRCKLNLPGSGYAARLIG